MKVLQGRRFLVCGIFLYIFLMPNKLYAVENLRDIALAHDDLNNVWALAGVKRDGDTLDRGVYIQMYDRTLHSRNLITEHRVEMVYNSEEDRRVRHTYWRRYSAMPARLETEYVRQTNFDATDPMLYRLVNFRGQIDFSDLRLVYNRYTQTFILIMKQTISGGNGGDFCLVYIFRYDSYNRVVRSWDEPRLLNRIRPNPRSIDYDYVTDWGRDGDGDPVYIDRYEVHTGNPYVIYNIDVDTTAECEFALVSITLSPGIEMWSTESYGSYEPRMGEIYLVPMYMSGRNAYHYDISDDLYSGFRTEEPLYSYVVYTTRNSWISYVSGSISKIGSIKIHILASTVVGRGYIIEFEENLSPSAYRDRIVVEDDIRRWGESFMPNILIYPHDPPVIRTNPNNGNPIIAFTYTTRMGSYDPDVYYLNRARGIMVISLSGRFPDLDILALVPRPDNLLRNGGWYNELRPRLAVAQDDCILTFQDWWNDGVRREGGLLGYFVIYSKIIPYTGTRDMISYSTISATSHRIRFNKDIVRWTEDSVDEMRECALGYWDADSLYPFVPVYAAWSLIYTNAIRVYIYYNPLSFIIDIDGDGLSDDREKEINTNTGEKDTDYDGLTDKEEYEVYHTNPRKPDSDKDGTKDGDEIKVRKTNPAKFDK